MFVLALIHTFPFIVFHIWKGDMMMQWKMFVVYWTGTVTLVAQAYLNIMSIGVIRYVNPKLIYAEATVT
jgi:ferric-chelate reductase